MTEENIDTDALESIPEEFFDEYPALRLIGNTDLVELKSFSEDKPKVKLSAKTEWLNPGGSVKDRPVLRMLAMALLSGDLKEGQVILDSSSGNAGIAYSMIGAILGFDVEIVVPGNASRERIERMNAHGANVVKTDPLEGYDEALREAHRRFEADPKKYFLIDQYSNDNNWKSHYYGTATEIIEQTDSAITHFVSGVGTGGSVTGIGRRLKELNPDIKIVMVNAEPFPGIEGLKPLDDPGSIIPKIYDPNIVDEKIDVSAEDSKRACAILAASGFFVGQSSGAYVYACNEIAKKIEEGHIITLLPDLGERYFSVGLWS